MYCYIESGFKEVDVQANITAIPTDSRVSAGQLPVTVADLSSSNEDSLKDLLNHLLANIQLRRKDWSQYFIEHPSEQAKLFDILVASSTGLYDDEWLPFIKELLSLVNRQVQTNALTATNSQAINGETQTFVISDEEFADLTATASQSGANGTSAAENNVKATNEATTEEVFHFNIPQRYLLKDLVFSSALTSEFQEAGIITSQETLDQVSWTSNNSSRITPGRYNENWKSRLQTVASIDPAKHLISSPDVNSFRLGQSLYDCAMNKRKPGKELFRLLSAWSCISHNNLLSDSSDFLSPAEFVIKHGDGDIQRALEYIREQEELLAKELKVADSTAATRTIIFDKDRGGEALSEQERKFKDYSFVRTRLESQKRDIQSEIKILKESLRKEIRHFMNSEDLDFSSTHVQREIKRAVDMELRRFKDPSVDNDLKQLRQLKKLVDKIVNEYLTIPAIIQEVNELLGQLPTNVDVRSINFHAPNFMDDIRRLFKFDVVTGNIKLYRKLSSLESLKENLAQTLSNASKLCQVSLNPISSNNLDTELNSLRIACQTKIASLESQYSRILSADMIETTFTRLQEKLEEKSIKNREKSIAAIWRDLYRAYRDHSRDTTNRQLINRYETLCNKLQAAILEKINMDLEKPPIDDYMKDTEEDDPGKDDLIKIQLENEPFDTLTPKLLQFPHMYHVDHLPSLEDEIACLKLFEEGRLQDALENDIPSKLRLQAEMEILLASMNQAIRDGSVNKSLIEQCKPDLVKDAELMRRSRQWIGAIAASLLVAAGVATNQWRVSEHSAKEATGALSQFGNNREEIEKSAEEVRRASAAKSAAQRIETLFNNGIRVIGNKPEKLTSTNYNIAIRSNADFQRTTLYQRSKELIAGLSQEKFDEIINDILQKKHSISDFTKYFSPNSSLALRESCERLLKNFLAYNQFLKAFEEGKVIVIFTPDYNYTTLHETLKELAPPGTNSEELRKLLDSAKYRLEEKTIGEQSIADSIARLSEEALEKKFSRFLPLHLSLADGRCVLILKSETYQNSIPAVSNACIIHSFTTPGFRGEDLINELRELTRAGKESILKPSESAPTFTSAKTGN